MRCVNLQKMLMLTLMVASVICYQIDFSPNKDIKIIQSTKCLKSKRFSWWRRPQKFITPPKKNGWEPWARHSLKWSLWEQNGQLLRFKITFQWEFASLPICWLRQHQPKFVSTCGCNRASLSLSLSVYLALPKAIFSWEALSAFWR